MNKINLRKFTERIDNFKVNTNLKLSMRSA